MKKFCLAAFLFGMGSVFFFSCGKDETKSPEVPADVSGTVAYEPAVSYEEACLIAQAAIEMLESDGKTRSTGRSINENKVLRYVVKDTRAGDADDTLMYVFNFDGGGFALVATDRRISALLATVDTGSCSPVRKTPRNVMSGFDLYMNAALDLLEGLHAKPYSSDLPSEQGQMLIRHIPLDVTEVKPMISVKWGTQFPYNGYCPMVSGNRAPAGFAATAVAQIMTAFTYPKTLQLTYAGADAALVTLNWPGILLHKNSQGDGFDCPEHRAIAQMCREIGQQMNMIYGKEESTADFESLPACFRHFGFATDPVADYSYEAIRQSYKKKEMVCMRGTAVDGLKNYDHIWVVDGIKHNITRTEIWFVPDKGGPNRLLESHTKTERLTHCNWGWEGDNNGYFSIDIFDLANPDMLDQGSEKLRLYNFTKSLKIITGIAPANN